MAFFYDFRKPIVEQGVPDIFDLQARARAERLGQRVLSVDNWVPPKLDVDRPKVETVAAGSDEPVYRYSACDRNPNGYSHQLPHYGNLRSERCMYCGNLLTQTQP